MRPAQTYVANDNDPPMIAPLGDAVGFRSFVVEKQREYQAQQNAQTRRSQLGPWRIFHSLKAATLIWLLALVGASVTALSDMTPGYKVLGWMAAIWSGLWLTFVASDYKKPRLSELSLLSAIAGFSALIVTAVTHFGLPISFLSGLCLFALATLFIALLLNTHIALLTSIAASLLWAGLHFDGAFNLSPIYAVVPLLLIAQTAIAFRQDSSLALSLCALVSYAWLGGLGYQAYLSGQLSPLYLIVGIFLFATLHFRVAKAAEDRNLSTMAGHIGLAWTIASLALLGLQLFFIHPEDFFWSSAYENAPLIQAIWVTFAGVTALLIAIAGIIRRRHARMFMSSIILMTTCAAIVPVTLWYHDLIQTQFEAMTLMPAFPSMTAILGGTVLASAIFFSLNNIRRGRFFLSLLGLGIGGLQAQLLITSEFMWLENLILLGTSFFVSLCVITMLGHVNETPDFYVDMQQFEAVRI